MVKRGVKASNLAGIRQRILTKFLQLVRSPDHNPEIARFEKVFNWFKEVLVDEKYYLNRNAAFFLFEMQRLFSATTRSSTSFCQVWNKKTASFRRILHEL